MNGIYFYGVGGHAKVAAEVAEALDLTLLGFYDDDPDLLTNDVIPVRPGFSLTQPHRFQLPREPMVITIGNNTIRARIADKLSAANFVNLIHPSALISASSAIDAGCVVFHGAIVQAGTRIGKHAIINTAASVDHDNVIGDFAHISPNATLCGNVHVGIGSQVGAGAVVLPGIKIGDWATVGAGAVVTKDVRDRCTVVGNPARMLAK